MEVGGSKINIQEKDGEAVAEMAGAGSIPELETRQAHELNGQGLMGADTGQPTTLHEIDGREWTK